ATLVLVASSFTCTTPTPTTPPVMAELVERDVNIPARDLFCGVGGCGEAPDADTAFKFREIHRRGSSDNLVVEDARGRTWNAKLGTEVHAEVAASRLLWAI